MNSRYGLGSDERISLTSNAGIRYEGQLDKIDGSTIALTKVRSFGTEDRESERKIQPSEDVYEYVIFRGKDIAEVKIIKETSRLPPDPAIFKVYRRNPTPATPGRSKRRVQFPGGFTKPKSDDVRSSEQIYSNASPPGDRPDVYRGGRNWNGAGQYTRSAASGAARIPDSFNTFWQGRQYASNSNKSDQLLPARYSPQENQLLRADYNNYGYRGANTTYRGENYFQHASNAGPQQFSGGGTGGSRQARNEYGNNEGQVMRYRESGDRFRPQNTGFGMYGYYDQVARSGGAARYYDGASQRSRNTGETGKSQKTAASKTKFAKDYDFETANAEMEKAMTRISVAPTMAVTAGQSEQSTSGSGTVALESVDAPPTPAAETGEGDRIEATEGDAMAAVAAPESVTKARIQGADGDVVEKLPAAATAAASAVYDRSKSFFDNISSETSDRTGGKTILRTTWREENKINIETFGAQSVTLPTRRSNASSFRDSGGFYNPGFYRGLAAGGFYRGYVAYRPSGHERRLMAGGPGRVW